MLRSTLMRAMARRGYETDGAASAAEARAKLMEGDFDALTLDRRLPDGDGLELCRELRAKGNDIPILVLTSRVTDDEMIEGLRGGADDYVIKPASVEVVLARLEALLRRAKSEQIFAGDILVDLLKHQLVLPGATPTKVMLTGVESRLLGLLAQRQDEIVPRELLAATAWRDADVDDNTIAVTTVRLRRKLGAYAHRLVTHRGRGLCLRSSDD